MKFKTKLENIRPRACRPAIDWVGDRTEKQAWKECPRGDWMLWYYAKKHPRHIRKITLAKGHCANTVRHLMKDKRSRDAVDVAIRFGEGKATKEELDKAAAAADTSAYAAYVADATYVADAAADAAAYDVTADVAADAKKENQQKTADICRKYLKI